MNRRFALIQALVSLVALAAVVWWATKQEAPELPSGVEAITWLVAALGLYVLATVVRAERWHRILHITGVQARRRDCYGLTCVGYMGNNVLPARAGEVLRVVLLSPRCDASKRSIAGSIVAERMLDVVALAVVFVVTVYGVLGSDVLPTNRPILMAGIIGLVLIALALVVWVLRRHHFFERVRDWLRPIADSPRALLSINGVVLLAGTFVLWAFEAAVYLAVARSVDLDISMTGALYLVALTNFVAALPAAPGSIGTFDAAVAWGAKRLGASGSAAVSYLIMLRFVLYVPITVVGFIILVVGYGGWSKLREALRTEREVIEAGPPPPPRPVQPKPQPQPSGAEAPTL
ncbi:MAG: lysylphosphatidylglycerol synthase transmembrane domain-containing protein [Thermoleophilaceae bacterium]